MLLPFFRCSVQASYAGINASAMTLSLKSRDVLNFLNASDNAYENEEMSLNDDKIVLYVCLSTTEL